MESNKTLLQLNAEFNAEFNAKFNAGGFNSDDFNSDGRVSVGIGKEKFGDIYDGAASQAKIESYFTLAARVDKYNLFIRFEMQKEAEGAKNYTISECRLESADGIEQCTGTAEIEDQGHWITGHAFQAKLTDGDATKLTLSGKFYKYLNTPKPGDLPDRLTLVIARESEDPITYDVGEMDIQGGFKLSTQADDYKFYMRGVRYKAGDGAGGNYRIAEFWSKGKDIEAVGETGFTNIFSYVKSRALCVSIEAVPINGVGGPFMFNGSFDLTRNR
ncbi:hypothetical protein [Pseudomonas putida]|uniref:Uncharacterized protein n=1 Tax=Pseudomonas putida TaxID=303 RepID=A0A6I6XT74_PSEPU|nr:hypothetical protein [Pseudomonas putida]QHG63359.2 hypothetical protein C2H86_02550 [Pseudomonas putida]